MTRVNRQSIAAIAALALALLVAPATQAATKYPTVSKVSPLKLGVGDTLTIRGKGFRSGKNKNTVVFRNSRGRTVFSKAGAASSTRITIVIPPKLMPFMQAADGSVKATKFQIRVVAKKLGKKYTASSKSPTIGPVGSAKSSSANAGSNGDCDGDGIINANESDRDNDYVNDTTETAEAHTDACDPDTDGDGILDGYEFRSAREFNATAVPYPGKRPYPNALDGTDANIDFDSDSLTLYEEYMAWSYSGRSTSPSLGYSDGTQNSQGSGLTDDLKDVDNDGLDNYNETHGPMMGPEWWTAIYGEPDNACGTAESAYPTGFGPRFEGTNFVDPDTDGDAQKLDGADDEDQDGYSNAFESYRPAGWCTTYQSIAHPGSNPVARVQPFNPCKPTYSNKCHLHPPAGYYPDNEDWESPYHGTYP